MSHELKELRNLLELAKEVRGGAPNIVWDAFDRSFPKEKRFAHSRSVIALLLRRPMLDMTMRDAYTLGATIAFLNLEIERLESMYEAQAKP